MDFADVQLEQHANRFFDFDVVYWSSEAQQYGILRIIPVTLVSLEPLVLSNNIHARSFALLTHRLVHLQLTSPLAYIIAQLLELRLF